MAKLIISKVITAKLTNKKYFLSKPTMANLEMVKLTNE